MRVLRIPCALAAICALMVAAAPARAGDLGANTDSSPFILVDYSYTISTCSR